MVRLHRGVFADPRVTLTATDRIRAAHLGAGPGSVIAGRSAQFLHHYGDEQRTHDAHRDSGVRRRGWIPLRTGAAAIVENQFAEVAKIERALASRGWRR